MKPAWWSQPFAEEGSAAAEGIVKQLGRPALDELTVLVREAAQNSWDARRPGHDVHFSIELGRLKEAAPIWSQNLLPVPPGADMHELENSLLPDSIMLRVSDRGTAGLAGPIRAGVRPKPGEQNDFVQFLRNVGEARDTEFGGGTYGFGKGIFYRLSRCASILVDTSTSEGAPNSRRVMGAALGNSFYDANDRRFTGRHWWGVNVNDIPDPVLGQDAATLASALGLPGFADGSTGTDIVIIGARIDSEDEDVSITETLTSAGQLIASSILWHLWPKMLSTDGEARMVFKVTVEGNEIAIPDPREHPELKPFADSYDALRAGDALAYTRSRDPRVAGFLKVTLAPDLRSDGLNVAKPFEGAPHHVARMRVADLVVDYLPGPLHHDALLSYGGVFRATEESDAYFAEAEPPTHDDWVISALHGTAKGVVQHSRIFIMRELARLFGTPGSTAADGRPGLGKLASRLSRLAPQIGGGGATEISDAAGSKGTGGGRRTGERRSARILDQPKLMVFNQTPYIVARVLVPASDLPIICSATCDVVLDGGGKESTAFVGAVVPEIIQWAPTNGGPAISGPAIKLNFQEDSEWWVYASYVSDAVTRIEVETVDA
jgi:hypothetical protein